MSSHQARHRRRFFRHPSGIPVLCRRQGHRDECRADLRNISLGGMAFMTTVAIKPGDVVMVGCPTLHTSALQGQVVWSDALNDGTRRSRCGIKFLDQSMFLRARIVEQLARIEAYRKAQQMRGRRLGRNDAAREWIEKEAARCPR